MDQGILMGHSPEVGKQSDTTEVILLTLSLTYLRLLLSVTPLQLGLVRGLLLCSAQFLTVVAPPGGEHRLQRESGLSSCLPGVH